MGSNPYHLLTATEAEENFGTKYFYRQRIYRLVDSGKIPDFTLKGKRCFLGSHILKAFLKDLEIKIVSKFPELDTDSIRVFYDATKGKRIIVDGIFGKGITVDTDQETEEDLLLKITHIIEWIGDDIPKKISPKQDKIKGKDTKDKQPKEISDSLPEEITWIKVNSQKIHEVKIKSSILISLPSIAQFIGIRANHLSEWIQSTTFLNSILSIHSKKIHKTDISGLFTPGFKRAHIPYIPFELLPEIIVAFRQSGRTVHYPQKAQLLYEMAKSTLEAVGLAISGKKEQAAKELADVGRQLGLNAADQIVAIFKQYETREFQVKTTKEFQKTIKQNGQQYPVIIGQLTLGITGRYPNQWKALGESKRLPKKITSSGREVMREVSPSDSVGMAFGEKHYIKEPIMSESIETGKQGKKFYDRLKKVGLLENKKTKKQVKKKN